MIDEAGGRGLVIGGAQMSSLHCNFMINTGHATGYDLEYLGETIRRRVFEKSGIRLEWEIKRLGLFMPGREVEPFLGLENEWLVKAQRLNMSGSGVGWTLFPTSAASSWPMRWIGCLRPLLPSALSVRHCR